MKGSLESSNKEVTNPRGFCECSPGMDYVISLQPLFALNTHAACTALLVRNFVQLSRNHHHRKRLSDVNTALFLYAHHDLTGEKRMR